LCGLFRFATFTHDQSLDAHDRNYELSRGLPSVKCREVADQNRFVNNPSEIVVNVVPFLVPNNADNPIEKGNVTIRLHRSCARTRRRRCSRDHVSASRGVRGEAMVSDTAQWWVDLHVAPAPRRWRSCSWPVWLSACRSRRCDGHYPLRQHIGRRSDTSCSSPGYSTIQSA